MDQMIFEWPLLPSTRRLLAATRSNSTDRARRSGSWRTLAVPRKFTSLINVVRSQVPGCQPVSVEEGLNPACIAARPKLITTIAGLPSREIASESTQ